MHADKSIEVTAPSEADKESDVTSTVDAPVSLPVLLMVGSLAGCSKTEAVAYTRALAEQYVTVAAQGSFGVCRDKPNNRYVYEVQEGGRGLSVLAGVLARLEETGQSVTLPLANKRTVSVGDNNGELFSLIDQAGNTPATDTVPLASVVDKASLTPLIKTDRRLLGASFVCVGVGLLILTASLLFGVVGKTYVLDKSVTPTVVARLAHEAVPSDLITKFLEAKKDAAKKGKRISKFEKKGDTWSWEYFK